MKERGISGKIKDAQELAVLMMKPGHKPVEHDPPEQLQYRYQR
jgi:hypothetical protein